MLIGITAEHEFFSQHFLDEALSSAIAVGVKAATDQERAAREAAAKVGAAVQPSSRTPWARLDGMAREVLKTIDRLVLENLTMATADDEARHQYCAKERDLITKLLVALGFLMAEEGFGYADQYIDQRVRLPLLGKLKTKSGEPYLWILHASSIVPRNGSVAADTVAKADMVDMDPLELHLDNAQFEHTFEFDSKAAEAFSHENWRELISGGVFMDTRPPRWVLLCGLKQWILLDRGKMADRRALRFDWTELLTRREAATLQAVAFMIGRQAFTVADGQCGIDKLDESSFRHAHGVSEDLKYALREAIELLGNEAAKQLRPQLATLFENGFTKERFAKELSAECLRYMYRLLFILYVESRPELNYVPIADENYLASYSFESLRDLELIPLISEAERNGTYFHKSIERLFRFFEGGVGSSTSSATPEGCASTKPIFEITPLKSSLFDPAKMPLLKKVCFPNAVLQHVVELMSLSRPASRGQKRSRRGRISYAHLGLSQLGAVYEALLSYQGFFAEEPLYEVKPAKQATVDPLQSAYFVRKQDLEDYAEEEKVYDIDPETGMREVRRYEAGTFIYRMAGSARRDSASYYTPEVLTKCIVKESLDELEKQRFEGKPLTNHDKAEQILTWRICEPAMGSAAFLNEAVNQVAERYMRYAMKADGAEPLTQTQYKRELQKVKMFLADRNIYGVDLNPVAVELGEVSLWLNALSDDKYVPWFGLQLYDGNSLIGCRREAYWKHEIEKRELNKYPKPHKVGPKDFNPGEEIWHFLVPDPGMSLYNDKDVKALEEEKLEILNERRKAFMKPLSAAEVDALAILSAQVEEMWQTWAEKLEALDKETTDPYSIYGHAETTPADRKVLSYASKQARLEELRNVDASIDMSQFGRLKLLMDYWCALWFWPISEAEKFPERPSKKTRYKGEKSANSKDWFDHIRAILNDTPTAATGKEKKSSAVTSSPSKAPVQLSIFEMSVTDQSEEEGPVEANWLKRRTTLENRYSTIEIVDKIAERERFLHWPLRFANIFLPPEGVHAGFDLTLGNPPWKVASWNSGDVLGNIDPKFVIHEKDFSAKGIQDVILGIREVDGAGHSFFERNPNAHKEWLTAYESMAGSQNFFNSVALYPELVGCQKDLFKFFLPTVWRNASEDGVQGLLHPETVLTETKGVWLRKSSYTRLRRHYQFANELKLFADVDHHTEFGINVYGKQKESPDFISINNLFTPRTIELCQEPSEAPVEGRKTADGKWNTKGHPDRVLHYDKETLATLGEIFGTSEEAPMLPIIHTRELLDILKKFGKVYRRLGDFGEYLTISSCWHESGAKKDETIRELAGNKTEFPEEVNDVILNGPHVAVGSPLFKCPDNPCTCNTAWTPLDLINLPDNYLPRVKYLPAVDSEEYLKRIDKVAWDKDIINEEGKIVYLGTPITDFNRVALRNMVGTDSERTLTAGIIVKGEAHIDNVQSICFKDLENLVPLAGYLSSLPVDFYIRQQNKGHLHGSVLRGIPFPDFGERKDLIRARALCLNALTTHYTDLWKENFSKTMQEDAWTQEHAGLNAAFFSSLTSEWQRHNALRTDLERRQALVELDVLVAQTLGLTLEELQTCYRLGFRVMRVYDADTWYDQTGRIVYTPNSLGLRGVGLPRKAKPAPDEVFRRNGSVYSGGLGWEDIQNMASGTVEHSFEDDTLPGKPRRTIVYVAPFFKMSREEDYAKAWATFEERLKPKKA